MTLYGYSRRYLSNIIMEGRDPQNGKHAGPEHDDETRLDIIITDLPGTVFLFSLIIHNIIIRDTTTHTNMMITTGQEHDCLLLNNNVELSVSNVSDLYLMIVQVKVFVTKSCKLN